MTRFAGSRFGGSKGVSSSSSSDDGSLRILGNNAIGQTLSLTRVFLSGDSPIQYTVQWLRDGSAVAGEDTATYVVSNADAGTTITAQVTLPDGSVVLSTNSISIAAIPGVPVINLPAVPAMEPVTATTKIGGNPPEYTGGTEFNTLLLINRFKGANGFSGGGPFDENGYPLAISGSTSARVFQAAASIDGLIPYTGSFRIYGRGKGTIRDGASVASNFLIGTNCRVDDSNMANTDQGGITVIGGVSYWYKDITYSPAVHPGKIISVRITVTDPDVSGNYIRDLALVHSTHIAAFLEGKVVIPEVAEDLSRLSCIRLMQSLYINNLDSVVYGVGNPERRYILPTHFNFSKSQYGGRAFPVALPIEIIVKAMNELAAVARARGDIPPALWYNFSVDVSDARAASIASHIFANLDADIRVSFAFGNEIWNGANGFETYIYALSAATETGKGGRAAWAGWRAKQLFTAIRDLNNNSHQVEFIAEGAANSSSWIMPYLAETEADGPLCNAYAIGGYFGGGCTDATKFLSTRLTNNTDRARLYWLWWRWGEDAPWTTLALTNLPSQGGTPPTIPDGNLIFAANPLNQYGVFNDNNKDPDSFVEAMARYTVSGTNLLFNGEPIAVFQTAPNKTVLDLIASGRFMPMRANSSTPGWNGMLRNSKSLRVTNHTGVMAAYPYLDFRYYEAGFGGDGAAGSDPEQANAVLTWLHYGDDPENVAGKINRQFLNFAAQYVNEMALYKSHDRDPYSNQTRGLKMLYDHSIPEGLTKSQQRRKWDAAILHQEAVPLPTTLTMENFTRDRVVFDTGAAFGLAQAAVTRSGTAAPGEVIQLRVVTAAGVQVVGWTDAATTVTGGTWTGTIFAPRGSAALRIEARLKRNVAVTTTTSNTFFAGHVVSFWGQSEWHRSVLTGFSSPGFIETVTDPNALTVAYSDNTGVGYGSGLVYSAVTDATPVSSHMTALSNALSIMRPGERFLVVFQTCSGTGLSSTLDETDGGRDWSQDLAVHNFAFADGNWPGLATQSWYSADAGMDSKLIDLILQACGNVTFAGSAWTEASSTIYEHDFSEIYDYSRTKWSISPPHRFESASSGPHMAAMRTRLREVFALPHLPAHMSLGIEMLTYRNGDTGGSDSAHPNTGGFADDGMHQVMRLTAVEFCRGLGLLAVTQPVFDNAALDPARQYVEVWSSAGAITTERAARSEAVPGGYPAVDGFKINGVKATDTSLVAGRVRVNWTVQDGDILTFGDDGCGSDGDDVALVADLWKQWPIVATAGLHPKVHGLPVRGLTPSSVLGVIPAAALPADPNTNPDLSSPSNFVNATTSVTGFGGWAASGNWVFDGAGKLSIGPVSNVTATGTLPWTVQDLPTELSGAQAELSFVITSPDAASGPLSVTVAKRGNGGGTTLYSGTVTIAHNTLVTLPLGVITATNTRLEVTFMRTTPVNGTLEIRRLTVKAASAIPATLSIMTMGQSNACDRATWDSAVVFPTDTWQLASGSSSLTSVVGGHNLTYSEGVNGTKIGMWPSLANAIRSAWNTTAIHYVPASHGQTDFVTGDWDDGGTQYNNAISASTAYLAATGRNIDLVAHMGHEYDGQNLTYDIELWHLYGEKLRDGTTFPGINSNTVLLMGEVRAATPSGGNHANVSWVNASNASVIARLTKAGTVPTWLGSTMTVGDDYHFDTTSVAANGPKFLTAYAAAKTKATPSPSRITLFDEWVLGSDNPTNLGESGGNGLIPGTQAPTLNSGYLTTGTGSNNGMRTGFADRDTMTFAAMVRPGASSGSYFSLSNSGLDPVMTYAATSRQTGYGFANQPFTNSTGGYAPSGTGFTMVVVIIDSDPNAPWSGIYWLTSAGLVAKYSGGHANLRAHGAGQLVLGKSQGSGGTYNGSTDFAWAGAWDGAMYIHEMRALYTTVTGTTLAGRGLTFA